jgi:formylglycine-generating enzyme required for sulfatase activity
MENSIGMKLNLIPAGRFLMGSPENEPGRNPYDGAAEGPQHMVAISKPYHFGICPVTVGQFRAFVRSTNHVTDAEKNGGARGVDYTTPRDPARTSRTPGWLQTEDHPVVCINLKDAVAFCEWLSKQEGRTYRLPTEAEWEYACRAGTQTAFAFGSDARSLDQYAWLKTNAGGKTQPVGTLLPNTWGLYDMHGNVWQWIPEWHAPYASAAQTDPRSEKKTDFRVLRGGAFCVDSVFCRSAHRGRTTPDWSGTSVGFRVVCEVSPAAETGK